MDSGNSGSLQSSSGDEEYDSRANAISAAIMNNNPGAPAPHVGPISNHPPPVPPPPSSAMFDPLSNYFDPMSRPPPQAQQPFHNTNSILNLDMTWSKTLRSEPNCTEINHNSMLPSSSSLQSLFAHHQGQVQNPAVSIPPVPENTSATNTPRGGAAADQPHAARNPKKRSRASRRAPTTVLTTDTTNFRAMVQEFTGIPAPPFTASSPFSRTRLDLYGAPSSMRSNHPLDTSQPPYLRRPLPQKVQLPPPFLAASSSSSLLSSSVIDHAIASSNTNNLTSGLSINTAPNATASLNYQLPSELALLKQQQPPPQTSSLFNVPNPILSSLLESNPAKASQDSSLETPPNDSRLKISFLDEFGLGHGGGPVNAATALSGLPGLISSDQTVPRHNSNNPISWGNGIGSVHENDQCQVRNASHVKLNFSSSSASFHGDKGADNVAATPAGGGRGEGMMESWICSSD